eukprot:3938487-Rhodomonas_salina.2
MVAAHQELQPNGLWVRRRKTIRGEEIVNQEKEQTARSAEEEDSEYGGRRGNEAGMDGHGEGWMDGMDRWMESLRGKEKGRDGWM